MWPTLFSLLSLGFCVSLRIWAAVGAYEKPSLSAWPSPVVPLGQNVTLCCHSGSQLMRFRLFKRDGASLPELQGDHVNIFTLGPVTREHAGSYTCSGGSQYPHSDPLQIVVTGVFIKPSISAHPGPLVQEGRNVTLRCQSQMLFDKFILNQENSTGHFQTRGEMLLGRHTSADFFIGPMTSGSAGTYRCYGSLSRFPYEWSAPSDPVDIVITGSTTSTCPSPMDAHTTEEAGLPQAPSSALYIILGLAVVFTSTSTLLAARVCHWCSTPSRKPEDLAIMEGQIQEDRPVSGMDSPAEDVIYAHLNLGTLSERLNTPTPLSPMHPFPEPSIYEEFDVKKGRDEP